MTYFNNNINKKFFNTNEFKYFFGGFIEGEASLSISLKKKPNSRFGYTLDPEFAIYQHVSGLHLLNNAKFIFHSGYVFKKPGSDNVFVFRIVNRQTIYDKVIPYFRKYVIPFSSKYVWFDDYVYVLDGLSKKKHLQIDSFIDLIKVSYSLNPFSKGKERKIPLDTICNEILRDYTPKKS
jgi:hypothetical protein